MKELMALCLTYLEVLAQPEKHTEEELREVRRLAMNLLETIGVPE